MPRGLPSFLLGFLFGVLTLTAFRHEIHLEGHALIMFLFAVCGGVFLTAEVIWYRRVRRKVVQLRGERTAGVEAEWAAFVWGSLLLFAGYFGLILMVVAF